MSIGALATGTAHADDNVSQICKSLGDAGMSHGACVSLAHGNPTGFFSHLCQPPGVPELYGTTNQGQCLKVVRALFGIE